MLYSFFRGFSLLAFVLVAAISAQAYTITYNLMGGVNHPDNPASYERDTTKLILKAPSKEGYAFLGWYVVSASGKDSSYYKGENFARFRNLSRSWLVSDIENFMVEARWGLVPEIPQQDERGCYLIRTARELYGIASVSKQDYEYSPEYRFEGCISLLNDIVVNKNLLDKDKNLSLEEFVYWIPVLFKGTFEGNGFKISGLRGNYGLFMELGNIYGGNVAPTFVKNLGVTDSYFSGKVVGGIAATIGGPVQMNNVYTDVSVHAEDYAGGLIGSVFLAPDECVTAMRPALNATQYAGKSAADYSRAAFIENSYSLGLVEGTYAGGIVGEMDVAVLRNVSFAGQVKGISTDCIVAKKGNACSTSSIIFEVENSKCIDNGDTAAYPVFKENAFSIDYVLYGGVNSEQNPASYIKGDSAIVLSAPQKENDVFEGWFLDSNFVQKIDTIKTQYYGDWKLYAKWKSFFVIHFEMNKGQTYNGRTFYLPLEFRWSADSAAFVLGTASRGSGFEFDGWYADSLFTKKITEIPAGNTEDVTVYAKWSPKTYTITYHLNGGTNHPDNPSTFTGEDDGFKFKAPTREGADFYRWTYGELGGVAEKISRMQNIDLYAEWFPKPQKPKQNLKGCYLIGTREELYWFAEMVNGRLEGVERNAEACASLEADIVVNDSIAKDDVLDLAGKDYFVWQPIEYFDGSFNGNGHSISGLLMHNHYSDFETYGGMFYVVRSYKQVVDIWIKDSYLRDVGFIKSFYITGNRMALSNVEAKSDWQASVRGNSVTLSGLVPGRTLLVMDVQGRVICRMTTQSSMEIDIPMAGRYLIRYGKQMKTISVR